MIKRKAFRKLGASKIGANLVTIPDVITDSYLKINADNTIAAQSSTEFAADFMGDLMTDVKPAIGGVYDIGASGYEWYDGYFYNSVKISDTAITGDAGDLFVTSDSFTVGDISIVDNVLTPLTTPLYGNREVIVDGGLTVASTDPAYLRLTQLPTENSYSVLDTYGSEGMLRFHPVTKKFQGHNGTAWAALNAPDCNILDYGQSITLTSNIGVPVIVVCFGTPGGSPVNFTINAEAPPGGTVVWSGSFINSMDNNTDTFSSEPFPMTLASSFSHNLTFIHVGDFAGEDIILLQGTPLLYN